MSLEQFLQYDPPKWGTPVEVERHRRIKLSVAAYAYEFKARSIISDAEFDKLALQVDVSVDTGNSKLDDFFRCNFDAHTGQWIHKHPDLEGIERLYTRYHTKGKKR